jgi:hypothetical protein
MLEKSRAGSTIVQTDRDGSNAIAPFRSVLGERLHRRALRLDRGFECEDILQRGAPVFADIAEGQIANIHSVNHQRAGDAEKARRIVRTQFLIFGQSDLSESEPPERQLRHLSTKLQILTQTASRHSIHCP